MEEQRILETDDDIVRFHDRPADSSTADSPYTALTPKGAEGGIQSGGWQYQNPSRIKKRIKQIIRRELDRHDTMSEEEATKVGRMFMVVTFYPFVMTLNFCNHVLICNYLLT